MENQNMTIDDLGGMIKRGFDENTKQHQEMLEVLNRHVSMLIDHTEILNRIEAKLEGMVYHKEFEELEIRVKKLEQVLATK